MTLEEMRQEVIDRGFDYIDSVRIGRFINRAYQQICSRYLWPFLEEQVEGAAPLKITGVRKVLSVRDVTQESSLEGVTYAYLANYYPTLTETGEPQYWWLDNETIKVFPVSTHTISVRYIKVPAELNNEDTPLIPDRWQYLLIDRAVVDCLRDDDEYEEARNLMRDVQEGIRLMAGDLLRTNLTSPRTILRVGGVHDYL